jgi:hypothetical protein
LDDFRRGNFAVTRTASMGVIVPADLAHLFGLIAVTIAA